MFSDPTRAPDGQEGRRIIFEVAAHSALTEVVIKHAAKTLSQILERSDAGAARNLRPAHRPISAGTKGRS